MRQNQVSAHALASGGIRKCVDTGMIWLLLMIAIVACGTPSPDVIVTSPEPDSESIALPDSSWGTVELIEQAQQLQAPVFAYTAADRIVTWTGARDDNQVTHFATGITDTQHTLDLPTFYPQQQTLLATNQGALKIWLDRNASESGLRLQAGTLSFEGTVATGIIPISTRRTRNYDVIQFDTRGYRIVSSGGLGEVTNLYLNQIDDDGRVSDGGLLQIDGDHPALLRDNQGQIHLFWLNDNGRNVFHARFDEIASPDLVDVRLITGNDLAVTDAILNFSAGYDGTTVYLLWNVRGIDDTRRVLMSSGQLSDERFSTPQLLTTSDGEPVQWATPARQFQSPFPVVGNHDDALSVLWLDEGTVTDTEFVVDSGRLIGLPHIDTTPDRIGVSWSQPTEDGVASLLFVERSRLP